MSTLRRRLNFGLALSAVCLSSALYGQNAAMTGVPGGAALAPAGLASSIGGLFGSRAPDLMALQPIMASLKTYDLSAPGTREALAPVYAAVQSQAKALQSDPAAAQAASPNPALAAKYVALEILSDFQSPETRAETAKLSRAYHQALPVAEKEKIRSELAALHMEAIARELGRTSLDDQRPEAVSAAGNSASAHAGMPRSWKLQPYAPGEASEELSAHVERLTSYSGPGRNFTGDGTGRFKTEYVDRMTESDASALRSYLSDGKLPFSGKNSASSALDLLEQYDRQKGTSLSAGLRAPLFAKALALRTQESLALVSGLYGGAAYELKKGDAAEMDELLPIVRKRFDAGDLRSVRGLYDRIYGSANGREFDDTLEALAARNQDGRYSRDIEQSFMGFMAARLENARRYDDMLAGGHGFHNLTSVNQEADAALKAIEKFKAAGIERSALTKGIDLDELAEVFKGSRYNSLGRRTAGADIFPMEGITGTGRAPNAGPYERLADMLAAGNPETRPFYDRVNAPPISYSEAVARSRGYLPLPAAKPDAAPEPAKGLFARFFGAPRPLSFEPVQDLDHTVDGMIDLANKRSRAVVSVFNRVPLRAEPGSRPIQVAKPYVEMQGGAQGPYRYTAPLGSDPAEEMTRLAAWYERPVTTTVNGVELTAQPGNSAAAVRARYQRIYAEASADRTRSARVKTPPAPEKTAVSVLSLEDLAHAVADSGVALNRNLVTRLDVVQRIGDTSYYFPGKKALVNIGRELGGDATFEFTVATLGAQRNAPSLAREMMILLESRGIAIVASGPVDDESFRFSARLPSSRSSSQTGQAVADAIRLLN